MAEAKRLFVAWSPENLPSGVERAVDRIDGARATTVFAGLDWLTKTETESGRVIDRQRNGYGIPIEMAVIEPREFARISAPEAQTTLASLQKSKVFLARSETRLRQVGKGARFILSGRRARSIGVIDDSTAQGYEMVMARPVPDAWPNAIRFLLIEADADVTKKRVRRAIRTKLPDSSHLRIQSDDQTPFLRYADAVRPQMTIKRAFGEFAARHPGTGPIYIKDLWRSRHITTRSVPLLGPVTCHEELFPQLRGAMTELRDRGLGHLVRRDEYAGCFNARYIATIPGTRLSRHSWGVAVDVNTSGNQLGQEPHQDPRLVRTMGRWGFTWGGTWPLPDGMHFEWFRFPR